MRLDHAEPVHDTYIAVQGLVAVFVRYQEVESSVRSCPLITVSELQRFKKEYGETLILHGRSYPFVTELPDIDEYKFKTYPPVETSERQLPLIERYNVKKVIDSIEKKERPLPFSKEVYGEDRYYEAKPESAKKGDLFDW